MTSPRPLSLGLSYDRGLYRASLTSVSCLPFCLCAAGLFDLAAYLIQGEAAPLSLE